MSQSPLPPHPRVHVTPHTRECIAARTQQRASAASAANPSSLLERCSCPPAIGIVGYGHVGRAMAEYFAGRFPTIFHDPQLNSSHSAAATREEINSCSLAVICVNTPPLAASTVEGSDKKHCACDVRNVDEVMSWLQCPLILLKSTVSVGTTARLAASSGKAVVFSPEYIGESTYAVDDFNTVGASRSFIFGGDAWSTNQIVQVFQSISGPTRSYIQTDSTTAEMAKMMENTFYATKILFCYEMDQICRATGVEYSKVREIFLMDPRVSRYHTSVFAENEAPFSGKCLPKDLAALISTSVEHGYQPDMLQQVQNSNDRIARIRNSQGFGPAPHKAEGSK